MLHPIYTSFFKIKRLHLLIQIKVSQITNTNRRTPNPSSIILIFTAYLSQPMCNTIARMPDMCHPDIFKLTQQYLDFFHERILHRYPSALSLPRDNPAPESLLLPHFP
jgi:hypothetical protein